MNTALLSGTASRFNLGKNLLRPCTIKDASLTVAPRDASTELNEILISDVRLIATIAKQRTQINEENLRVQKRDDAIAA